MAIHKSRYSYIATNGNSDTILHRVNVSVIHKKSQEITYAHTQNCNALRINTHTLTYAHALAESGYQRDRKGVREGINTDERNQKVRGRKVAGINVS